MKIKPSPLGAEGLASYTSVRWQPAGLTDEVESVLYYSLFQKPPHRSGEVARRAGGAPPWHGGLPAQTIWTRQRDRDVGARRSSGL